MILLSGTKGEARDKKLKEIIDSLDIVISGNKEFAKYLENLAENPDDFKMDGDVEKNFLGLFLMLHKGMISKANGNTLI